MHITYTHFYSISLMLIHVIYIHYSLFSFIVILDMVTFIIALVSTTSI